MLDAILHLLGELYFFLGYISNKDSFPAPLGPEEEAACLEGLKRGEAAAREKLILHNQRLCAHIAKKYRGCGIEQDDLISLGTVGLIKAIGTFRVDGGAQLATYAARCIENEILMGIRAQRKQRSEVFLQDAVGVDKEGNEIALIDVLGSGEDLVEREVQKRIDVEEVYALIRGLLNEKERLVLELRFGLNGGSPKPQREVAETLGISRSYVSRLEKKAIEKLARELAHRRAENPFI
jgi:RNA polymerase sporulation-specific sigma factor